jgi:peptide/nickel transport system ATP-binding protein
MLQILIKINNTMKNLLEIKNLNVEFDTDEGRILAVNKVSLSVKEGEILGIVGESGSGKSVTAKSIMQLNPGNTHYEDGGEIIIDDENVLKFSSKKDLKKIRGGKVSMIFQEPMASFAPAIKIGHQMIEQLLLHKPINKAEAKNISIDMLKRVGIADAEKRFNQYAFELSGGMRQRAMIAMALSTMPKLLLADEPTTALDVTIQAQVLDLIKSIVKEYRMGVVFITHDLGVIAQTADYVAVMYLGCVVESGPVREIIKNPKHPYTIGLLEALPDINNLDEPLKPVPGNIPSPLERPSGCVFHTRCNLYEEGMCNIEFPELKNYSDDHQVACLKVNTNE